MAYSKAVPAGFFSDESEDEYSQRGNEKLEINMLVKKHS